MTHLTVDSAFARKLMGHPSDGTNGTPSEITPTQMDECLDFGYEQIQLFTKKRDWDASDPIIHQLRMAEAYFASSVGRSIWRDPDNKSQEHYNRAKTLCTAIMENQEMASDVPPEGASVTSVAYTYKTNALNETAQRYRSPRVDV